MIRNLKLLLIGSIILIFYSIETKAQFLLTDTLIYFDNNKEITVDLKLFPDSTFYYCTNTFPRHHSKGSIKFSKDTLILMSEPIELKEIENNKTPLYKWINFENKKYLITEHKLLSYPDRKEKFKLKK